MKLLLLTPLLCLTLGSCTSDGKLDQERASRVVDLALSYAVATGRVSPSDAALVREVGTIVLDQPAQPTGPAAPVTVTK